MTTITEFIANAENKKAESFSFSERNLSLKETDKLVNNGYDVTIIYVCDNFDMGIAKRTNQLTGTLKEYSVNTDYVKVCINRQEKINHCI